MKIYIAYCLDGTQPWQSRQVALQECASFEETLRVRGVESINFSSFASLAGTDCASTEKCVAHADAVVAFRGRTMLGASDTIRELSRRHRKPIFEFVFLRPDITTEDFGPSSTYTWPEFQQFLIAQFDEVFSWITPLELERTKRAFAQRPLV